jgi:hypothetical protein
MDSCMRMWIIVVISHTQLGVSTSHGNLGFQFLKETWGFHFGSVTPHA